VTLVAPVDDYSPAGWSTAAVVRVEQAAAYTITGFDAVAAVTQKTLINASGALLTLAHESLSSLAPNRIITNGSDLVLGPNDIVRLVRDTVTDRWRVY
jgi:hypothetical protein